MKLSEAMMLGSTTCKMIPKDWDSCALGAAANAIGIPHYVGVDYFNRIADIVKEWSWILEFSSEGQYLTFIFHKFDDEVCGGKMTFEELVDYVISVEPKCGECNSFACTCVGKEKVENVLEESTSKR